jgi:hypothetical protein
MVKEYEVVRIHPDDVEIIARCESKEKAILMAETFDLIFDFSFVAVRDSQRKNVYWTSAD